MTRTQPVSPATRGRIKPMTPGIPQAARVRAYLAGAIVTLGLTGVAYRAWALQVNEGTHYAELAARQHALTVDVPAPRGEVVDAHGRPLAVSADTDSIWANPRDVRDVTETAAKLAAIVGDDARVLESKLGTDRKFVWIARHVTPEVAKAVQAAKLPGIEIAREPRRWYPARTVAGPVIGRADIDGKGLDGIELAMNEYLTGTRGSSRALRDARGRRMFADGVAQPEPGATVHLTLDRSIQAIAESALAASVTANKAKNGVAVVLDVATGKVLALASSPTYDPNTPNAGAGVMAARNRPVTDVYESGSVMKIFSIASALEAGVVEPETGFDLNPFVVGNKMQRDVHHDTYGTVGDILKRSSNVGTVKIALRLGREKLYAGLKNFGFGAKTGIELPGEQRGLLRDGAKWRDIELATISYGYGLTVTPLQIAAALASIGNAGVYHSPRVVDRVVDHDGTVLYTPESAERRVVSARTAGQMVKMLGSVFDKGLPGGKGRGTASTIVVPGFVCGGKTGTAHKWDPVAKHYALHRHLGSFAGLAPLDNPRLAIVVLIDEPSAGDYYGGEVAGPVFATIASEALRYLGVPGVALPPPVLLPGQTAPALPALFDPQELLDASLLSPTGWVTPTLPVAADIDPAAVEIPSFAGLGYARAIEAARAAHLAIEVSGSGRVAEQDPPPGPAPVGTRVTLRFSDGNLPTPAAASAGLLR